MAVRPQAMQLTQKINNVVEKVRRLLLSRVGFWAGQTYGLSPGDNPDQLTIHAQAANRKWVLIVGRDHYYESITEYPIGNLRDLKKALKIEPWSFPYEGVRLVQITRISPQSHRVTNWVVKAEVLEHQKSRPVFMVPETACFQALASSGPLTISRLGKTVLVISTDNGLMSGIESESNDDSVLTFWRTQLLSLSGLPHDSAVSPVSETNFAPQLIKGLLRIIKQSPMAFFVPLERSTRSSYPWQKALKMALLAGFAYLSFSSLYVVMTDAWIDHRLSAARTDSAAALELRKDIRFMQAEVNEVATIFSEVAPLWVTWDVVTDLLNKGVTVSRINSIDGSVTITASAAKASEVLSYLSNDARVSEVKYAQPIRQAGQLQSFAIAVRFNWPYTASNSQILTKANEGLIGMRKEKS
tara:strand:- start:369 stop:1607 length:1239 start_codon:yes stop_codon:yes gene_type:complete